MIDTHKKSNWHVIIGICISIIVIVSCLVIYIDLKATPIQELKKASKGLNWTWFLIIFVLVVLSYAFEATILRVLTQRKGEPKRSIWSYFRIPIIQALFNAITPMGSGGQPSQLVAMMQMGVEGARATSILFVKFIIYQIVMFVIDIITIICGFHLVISKFSTLAFFIVIGLILHVSSTLFLLAVIFAYKPTIKISNWLMDLVGKFIHSNKVEIWRRKLLAEVDKFYVESKKLRQEKRKLILIAVLTILQLLSFYSVPYAVLHALNIFSAWVPVVQMNIMITMFMATIPLPGAVGGAEYSFQTLFSTFIHTSGALVLGMFLWRFATYFFGMLLGILGVIFQPKKIKSN